MSDEQTVYYLAGEKAEALIRAFCEQDASSKQAYHDFQESIGACAVYRGGTFDFDPRTTPPAGLRRYARKKRDRGDWYFDRTPAGQTLRERFTAVPRLPCRYRLTADLRGEKRPTFGPTFGYQILPNSAVVITAREGWKPPIGCTRIKTSAYWRMVEAGEE